MSKIAVIGNSEFNLGFELVGIKDTFQVEENDDPLKIIKEVKTKNEISIVLVDERLISKIDPADMGIIDESVDPVFITLSTEATQEGLKNMIKKSIGIDLWKGE